MRNVCHGLLFQYAEGSIPYFDHRIMQPAVFFIAVFTSFIKIKTDAGQHGNGSMDQPDDSSQRNAVWRKVEIIATAFTFLAAEDPLFLQLKQDAFQKLQGNAFFL